MERVFKHGSIIFLLTILLSGLTGAGDQSVKYKPTKKSLNQHEVPKWFDDAKFGIFIHWSLSSVPAYAYVSDKKIWEIAKEGGHAAQLKYNPYAEWYLNTMQIEGSPTQKYHKDTYGEDFTYFDFAPIFNQEVKKWDPDMWASTFKDAGARYVVLVTKHHDGFLLWPSDKQNPNKQNYFSKRDLVGELTKSVKAEGMKMGFYYSGALDWTFQTVPISDSASFLTNGAVTKEYAEYVDFHYRELIDNYQPSILWNDIGYPPDGDCFSIMAYFYNKTPDGIVNDRWMKFPKYGRKAMMSWPIRNIINWSGNRLMKIEGISQPKPPHYDYVTPEYASFHEIKEGKWESTRGIGNSFGYNKMETGEQYLKSPEAIRMLIDVVSKNGNLLLNVGPRPDGSIPKKQIECISGMGKWLSVNGEAIYSTRPWVRAEAKTTSGIDVRFTKKGDKLFVILLDTPKESSIEIPGLTAKPGTLISLINPNADISWSQKGDSLEITLPEELPESPAHVLTFSMLP